MRDMRNLTENEALIAKEVGLATTSDGIKELAECVRMEDQIETNPQAVANEITAYLDSLVRNP